MNNKLVYLCDSCGAEVVFKKNDNIKECSYCGNFIAIIDEKIDIHGYKKVLPFELDYSQVFDFLSLYEEELLINNSISIIKNQEYLTKVYIPYYFINFDVIYSAYCKQKKGYGRNQRIIYYYSIVDGKIENNFYKAIMTEGIFLGEKFIDETKQLTFDPSIINGGEIIDGAFFPFEKIIEEYAKKFGKEAVKKYRVSILYDDSAEYNERSELILVPFYKYTVPNTGLSFFLLGQDFSGMLKKEKRYTYLKIGLIIFLILLFFVVIYSFLFSTGILTIFFVCLFVLFFNLFSKIRKKKEIKGSYKKKKIKD